MAGDAGNKRRETVNEKPQIVNGTKTDALKSAVLEEIERRRKEIDVAFWGGSSTVAIIIRLRGGKPFKVSFRTETESML